jgi:hypothetical protein
MSTRLRGPAVDHINPTFSGPSSPKKRLKPEREAHFQVNSTFCVFIAFGGDVV